MRPLFWLACCVAILTGCGGGGGGSGSNTVTTPVVSTACNSTPIVVDGGPADVVNYPFVSVTVCTPGNANQCQIIDHVLLDTGSYGLRIQASVLTTPVLRQEVNNNNVPLVECTKFADGYAWGPIKIADVKVSGESATSVPIQIIGLTAGFPTVPTDCSGSGPSVSTVSSFGANGVLGVGVFQQDCGDDCVTAFDNRFSSYYLCASSNSCVGATATLAQQVQNIVGLFPTDNNGVLISLPAVPAAGSLSVTGSLIFGIGTQSNNALGNAKIFSLDGGADFTTLYKSNTLARSFVDSGSNGLFFTDSITVCPPNPTGFYCPGSTLDSNATLVGINGANAVADFSVANATTLFSNNRAFNAFSNLGGTSSNSQSFDWGLPFFFGRNVFFAIEQPNVSGTNTPYFAY